MFTVENVIRSATRKFSDDPLNILVVCSNNEKYLSLLSENIQYERIVSRRDDLVAGVLS